MSRSIWKSGVWFALAGPPVGAAIALLLILASFIFYNFVKPGTVLTDIPLAEQSFTMLVYVAALFIGCYVVGGPGAFAAGATMAIMSRRAFGKRWVVAATILVGGSISMLTIYGLDEYVLPHPHLGKAPGLGPNMWLLTGGIGALAAAICGFVLTRRQATGSSGIFDRRGGQT